MSLYMQKMWISIIGMILLALAMFVIYVSRYKLENKILKVLTSIIAWIMMITGGIIVDRKSTRLNSSHVKISYAVFCLTKKNSSYTVSALRNFSFLDCF